MRPCPICSKGNVLLIEIIPLLGYNDYPINGPYILSQCGDCGFYYGNVSASQTDLDNYYINLSKYENIDTIAMGSGGITPLDQMRLQKTFRNVLKYINDKAISILDVGCANGGLLHVFQSNGYLNIHGNDPSRICALRTKQNLGCIVYEGSFFKVDFERTFDLVTVTHVLEHVIDVLGFMRKILSILNEDGIIYLECPDANSYNKVIHSPNQEFNTEHINHFDSSDYYNLAFILDVEYIDSGSISFSTETNNEYFASFGVLRKRKVDHSNDKFRRDSTTDHAIKDYLKSSFMAMENLLNCSEFNRGNRIFMYGIGQLSFKLIAMLESMNCNLILYDGDTRNKGKKIGNYVVQYGNDIVFENFEADDVILICSIISFTSIKNSLITFFNDSKKVTPNFISIQDLM